MGRSVARIIVGIVLLIVVAGGVFLAWAHQPAIAPVSPPAVASFDRATIAKGAQLVAMGNCAECHTAPHGKPFAGGYPVPTPFGTIYGSNLTPDPKTGIGKWSEAAFLRAMHKGIRRDGQHLYPAFPYTHFTKVSDADVKAIYAYLMTRQPVVNRVRRPKLPFPLDQRVVMAGWNLLFFHEGRYQPNSGKSAAWNRGAYIAEGLGHCGACHTPLNVLGAEKTGSAYAGGEAEGWHAPALTAASPSPAGWTKDQLAVYLKGGFARDHGLAAGPMAGVALALGELPEGDVDALATYTASLGSEKPEQSRQAAIAAAEKAEYQVTSAQAMKQQGPAKTGEAIFASACATCHFTGGAQPFYRPVWSGLSSVVNAPDPRNFLHIVMDGLHPPSGDKGRSMPPFRAVLNADQTTRLARYVRSHFTNKGPWNDLGKAVAKVQGKSGS